MNIFIHISIHFFVSLLAGTVVFFIWKKAFFSFLAAIVGGFLIDVDHLVDYYIAFGFYFRLDYFLKGYQFLESDKLYIFLHGWEYGIILLVVAFIVREKITRSVFLALALGLFFHLTTDVFLNSMPAKSYSLVYRIKNEFSIEKLVYEDHYKNHLLEKMQNKDILERN